MLKEKVANDAERIKIQSTMTKWRLQTKHITKTTLRGLFDKFVENIYKIVSHHSILIDFAHATVECAYDRYRISFNQICSPVKSYKYFTNIR